MPCLPPPPLCLLYQHDVPALPAFLQGCGPAPSGDKSINRRFLTSTVGPRIRSIPSLLLQARRVCLSFFTFTHIKPARHLGFLIVLLFTDFYTYCRFGTNQVLDISNRTFAFASLWFVLPYPDTSQVPERKSAATRQLVHCISHIQYLLTRLTTARRDFTHFT